MFVDLTEFSSRLHIIRHKTEKKKRATKTRRESTLYMYLVLSFTPEPYHKYADLRRMPCIPEGREGVK